MERHRAAVSNITTVVRGYFDHAEPYRIFHGSTNSTRPRPSKDKKVVDISALQNVILVDRDKRTALVEPNVPMDRLVVSTLRHGLMPPVVMEFPGITVGGGYAGTAGESSSFRHGFFDQSVARVEMVLADGEVVDVDASGEMGDLFRAAAGALGTLGTTTLLEVRLVAAKKFVRTRYRRTRSVAEVVAAIQEEVGREENDYVDGILFSKNHGVVITGQLTEEKPANVKPRTFSRACDPWFYLHAEERTRDDAEAEDFVPLCEYLFRYDRGGFWVGRAAFAYFKVVPFNRYTRCFLDDFLHTRMLYRALHASGESARFMVQDIAVPFETAKEFVDYTAKEHAIWPLWLCPLKRRGRPTFHPFTRPPGTVRHKSDKDKMMLNIGVWGWGPSNDAAFVAKNRELENKVRDLGGMKWLYAHTYYPEDEFWPMYSGKAWYDALRNKYRATTLPSVWDKVHVDPEAARTKKQVWLRKLRPLGGIYGIWKSIQSKDYLLHRNAEWK